MWVHAISLSRYLLKHVDLKQISVKVLYVIIQIFVWMWESKWTWVVAFIWRRTFHHCAIQVVVYFYNSQISIYVYQRLRHVFRTTIYRLYVGVCNYTQQKPYRRDSCLINYVAHIFCSEPLSKLVLFSMSRF